jgi:hypothetical protein
VSTPISVTLLKYNSESIQLGKGTRFCVLIHEGTTYSKILRCLLSAAVVVHLNISKRKNLFAGGILYELEPLR